MRAKQRQQMRIEMKGLSRLPSHLLRDMGLEQYAAPREPDIHILW
ncbi:MAG: hypothetical protein AAF366_15850 [Pseudomonadota bacterium]